MLNILKTIPQRHIKHLTKRFISSGCKLNSPGNYEGEGKTTMNILNSESELGLLINGYSEVGFRLNNDVTILGPMVLFPRSVLSWNVKSIDDINEETLSLFTVLEPKIDIVVVGVGDKCKTFNKYKPILEFSRKYKIAFEILPTSSACSTFNFLSSEGRYVAGAFIPPTHVEYSEDDELQSKIRYANLYETD